MTFLLTDIEQSTRREAESEITRAADPWRVTRAAIDAQGGPHFISSTRRDGGAADAQQGLG